MLDEEEKNAALGDKNKRVWVFFFPDTVTVLRIWRVIQFLTFTHQFY